MATATTFDMQLIAQDPTFSRQVKASLLEYIIFTAPNRNFAAQVFNNIDEFLPKFTWAAAVNSTLANNVLTVGNANTNFTSSTTGAQVASAIQLGLTDNWLNNAVASAYVAFASI